MTEPGRTSTALDGAMHSVWLHGKWRWLTSNMTTDEREAAWEAVKRFSLALDPDDEPLSDDLWAWWREPSADARSPRCEGGCIHEFGPDDCQAYDVPCIDKTAIDDASSGGAE